MMAEHLKLAASIVGYIATVGGVFIFLGKQWCKIKDIAAMPTSTAPPTPHPSTPSRRRMLKHERPQPHIVQVRKCWITW